MLVRVKTRTGYIFNYSPDEAQSFVAANAGATIIGPRPVRDPNAIPAEMAAAAAPQGDTVTPVTEVIGDGGGEQRAGRRPRIE